MVNTNNRVGTTRTTDFTPTTGATAPNKPAVETRTSRSTGITTITGDDSKSGLAPDFIARQAGLNLTISAEGQKYLDSLPPNLRQGLSSVASGLNVGLLNGTINANGSPGLQKHWEDYMGKVALNGATDVNALVQQVLRESYMETTKDLQFYAEKVKFYNSVKKAIRDELTRAREAMAGVAGMKDESVLPNPFFGKTVQADFVGGQMVTVTDNAKALETVDAIFTSGLFAGERAGAGSNVDPIAIRMGDGPAVIDTPGGSFVVGGQWMQSPTFTTNGSQNWTPDGGLSGVANQMWEQGLAAADKDGDGQIGPDEEQFLPLWWGGGDRPPGATEDGTEASKVVWKSPEDCLNFLIGEVNAGRITLAGAAKDNFPTRTDVGLCNITIEFYAETRTTTWFGPDMGILVNDMNNDGQITNDELFGDTAMTGRAGLANGYEDMARLDVNQDGMLSGDEIKDLKIWQDINSDGKVQPGEMKSILEHGIMELSTNPTGGATGEAGVAMTSNGMATDVITKADLDAYIKGKEEQLNSVGDDAQLANVDLQNMLQKQQQTLQMMSNISKMLHDTAMATIRKIGG